MRIHYNIIPAPQGTSTKEISKAKRIFRKIYKNFITTHLDVVFQDSNCVIKASYYAFGNLLGTEIVADHR